MIIFRKSDIVSLHIPLTEETVGLVDREKLALMKPTAYLINTCRGKVVREQDLIDALKEGKIQGAGLDVLDREPPALDIRCFRWTMCSLLRIWVLLLWNPSIGLR